MNFFWPPLQKTFTSILRQCHVRGATLKIRTVHNEAVVPESSTEQVIRKLPLLTGTLPRNIVKYRPQFTLQTRHPSSLTRDHVLSALKDGYIPPFMHRVSLTLPQAVVILTSPTFAPFIQDEDFISGMLHTLAVNQGLPQVSSELDVVCACVDGVAPNPLRMSAAYGRPADEGFSILQGQTRAILPRLHDGIATDKDTESLSTLTFLGNNSNISFTVPLANTLFRTGRRSELVVSKWRFSNSKWGMAKSERRQNVNVMAFGSTELVLLASIIPAVPLTPARKIASGLGNIVRQLDFGKEGIGPASRELEKTIELYSELQDRAKATVSVWALVIPETTQFDSLPGELKPWVHDPEYVKTTWTQKSARSDYVGHMIKRGATLCRVLSGGGGWGAKQGLLSLDPQTSYNNTPDMPFGHEGNESAQDRASALGTVAEPGSLIQFLVGDITKVEIADLQPSFEAPDNKGETSSVVIGTVPSTVDDVPISEVERDSRIVDIKFYGGHFGCVSESGTFIRHTPDPSTTSTKISEAISSQITQKMDLPYSYFFEVEVGSSPSQESELEEVH